MRPVLVVLLLVVATPVAALAPVAGALEWCTAFAPVEGRACSRHLACLHRTRTGSEETCLHGLPHPCGALGRACAPQQALP